MNVPWLRPALVMNAEERQFEIARSLFSEANDAFFLFDPRTQLVTVHTPKADVH